MKIELENGYSEIVSDPAGFNSGYVEFGYSGNVYYSEALENDNMARLNFRLEDAKRQDFNVTIYSSCCGNVTYLARDIRIFRL
ncbi:hypothetical protein [Streptococcus pluranimalium]|uniref:hypothetical protein n=1 Tax=Streptococcus pluranimalium TaxID=82348 RepID=UPI003F690480